FGTVQGEAPPDPNAPPGSGPAPVDWGTFEEQLPYGPKTITQAAQVGEGIEQAGGLGGGITADARSGLMAVAAGLVLALSALLIRRFLAYA
ncbi:MAG: hypothetical protein ACRDH6_01855, partial [Actinomycetota bacterium]